MTPTWLSQRVGYRKNIPPQSSAGLLLYRKQLDVLEVFLAHPGGPFWAKKDAGAWSIPKGLVEAGEDLLAAAVREFEEETGYLITGRFIPLTPVRQGGGKIVHAWAVEGDCDASSISSNTFSMEWPPRSGKLVEFPEIDRAAWFTIDEARVRILKGQAPLLDELVSLVGANE